MRSLNIGLLAVAAAAACAPRSPGGTNAGAGRDAIVLLVSIDGLRFDYIDREPAPNLKRLASRGVRARWMEPSFPTQTFPNHYTIVTGLRPARSGMVNNTFYDPRLGRFRYTDTAAASRPGFWQGEPIWVTAARQGRRTAAFFWPGSDVEIGGVRPERWKRYDGDVPNADRVDSVLSWLALPAGERPSLVTLYFSDYGHENGPDSPELRAAVAHIDSVMGRLMDGLEARGLDDVVNIIVVSDHGMIPLSNDRVVRLDEYLDTLTVQQINLGQFIALAPRDNDTSALMRRLRGVPHLHAYRADSTPERWHYRGNPRIAPVVGVMDAGWTLSTTGWLQRQRRPLGGGHGFDPADSLIKASFIAAGPAFPRGRVVAPFSNVHVYELLCLILGLPPAPNDGSADSVRALLR